MHRPLVAFALVSALLSGCGGGDDGDDDAGGGGGTAAAATPCDRVAGAGPAPSLPPDALDAVEIERQGPYTHPMGPVDYGGVAAPSGGDHPPSPYWLNCGVYTEPVPPELAVHSLEHGTVWIAVAEGEPELLEQATVLRDRYGKVIVSPVPGLEHPVELVAWSLRLALDDLDGPEADAFLQSFIDAASAPEAGSVGYLGLGEPPEAPELPTE